MMIAWLGYSLIFQRLSMQLITRYFFINVVTRVSEVMPWTHWGRVTHICVSELTIIGSDNGLSPGQRQAIIWNNAGLLLIEPLGTNFSEISIGIQTFSFKKMHLIMSSAKWRPFCLGLNVLIGLGVVYRVGVILLRIMEFTPLQE